VFKTGRECLKTGREGLKTGRGSVKTGREYLKLGSKCSPAIVRPANAFLVCPIDKWVVDLQTLLI